MMKGIPLSSRLVRVVVLAIKQLGPNCPSSSSVRSHQRASRSPVSCISSRRSSRCLLVLRIVSAIVSLVVSCFSSRHGVLLYPSSCFLVLVLSFPPPSPYLFPCFVGEWMRTQMGAMSR